MNPDSQKPLAHKAIRTKKVLSILYYDPAGDERFRTHFEAEAGPLTVAKSMEEVLNTFEYGSTEPDLLVLIEREGEKEKYRVILSAFTAIQRPMPLLYLYGKRARYASEFSEMPVTFLPVTEWKLFRATLRTFLRGVLYRKGVQHFRRKARTLEEKLVAVEEDCRREREELRGKMEREETWFASRVHELFSPVEGIIGITRLLARTPLDPEQRSYLKRVESIGYMLRNLINDLSDFSKIESGEVELEVIEFDLNEVLDRVAAAVAFQAESKGLELIFDTDRHVPARVVGDPLRLSQILINLINNAVKFTEKGEILLRVSMQEFSEEKGTILFEVIDTGIGMAPEEQQRVFRPSLETDSAVYAQDGGTGLGLMLSKQLIEKMGGEIGVESSVDKGSRFYFTLPTRRTERRSYRLPSKELMFKRVLILDPNPHSAGALARMLRYFHYGTVAVEDRNELDSVLQNGEYDIVIVDESMESLCDDRCIERISGAHLVAMRSEYGASQEKQENKGRREYQAILKKPLTQQKVFEMILQLYSEKDRKEERA